MDSKKKEKQILQSRSEFEDTIQEGQLVTALVYMPEAISEVSKMIPTNKVFQNESIRFVYDAILTLYLSNMEIKKSSVLQTVIKSGRVQAIKSSGLSLNFDLTTPSNIDQVIMVAESIISLYRRQMAYQMILELNAKLLNNGSDLELSEKVFSVYEALTISGGKVQEKTSRDAAGNALKEIDRAMKQKRQGGISGVPTGSDKLDRILGGWQNDELILLAGRPGSGKTACALDFCLSAAERGYPVGYFSIEMDSEKLNYRLASSKTGIEYSKMIKGTISDAEYVKIETALSEIANLPIYYFDDASISNVHKLETVAAEWCRKRGVKLLIIDYIQYLQVNERGGTYEQITAVSKAIKTMQRKLQVPVIGLAQLGRKVEDRADPTPQMEDLKESGQLEQDASRIIGLLNVDYYTRKGKPLQDENGMPYKERSYRYVILKDRSGSHYVIERFCDIATNRFSDNEAAFNDQYQISEFTSNKVFNSVEPNF